MGLVWGAELQRGGWKRKRQVNGHSESRVHRHRGAGKGLDSGTQTERAFTFPGTRTGDQHSLEPGDRDDDEHKRKVKIAGRVARDGLSDTQSGLRDRPLL